MVKYKYSLIANNYPSILDNPIKNGYKWLEAKKNDDNADGLWRIHDTLYDFTSFIHNHPGGPDWLILTEGTDITEAFECHHINIQKTLPFLEKYKIGEASKRRNIKLTFNENGFYRTLKKRVFEKLETIDLRRIERKSKIIIDTLLYLTFMMAVLSVKYNTIILAMLAGVLLGWTTTASHNFFHRKDNFRMFYFNLSFMNYKEWRITHALSHHLYPNSIQDMEILLLEPLLCWLPTEDVKGPIKRYAACLYGPFVWSYLFFSEFVNRLKTTFIEMENQFHASDIIPFSIPFVMYLFGGQSDLYLILKMWMCCVFFGSFSFSIVAFNAGHHHHEIVHDGDKLRDDLDWGVYTMDTVIDRADLRGKHFLVLTHFGDHALHHLFPTLDHGILPEFYPILFETIDEFEADLRCCHWFPLIVGQHKQLLRIEPLQDCPLTRNRLRKQYENK